MSNNQLGTIKRQINYDDNCLDFFRWFAAIQVFCGHFITHFDLPELANVVYYFRGVPILFFICGFLAAKSINNRNTKEWYLGRIRRIIPGYWGCVIISTIVILLLYPTRPTIKEILIYFVTQFLGMNFYTGSWLRNYGVGTPNGVLWTITVQIQFFVIVPIINKYVRNMSIKRSWLIVLFFMCLSIIINNLQAFMSPLLFKLISVTVIPYLYFLLAGMLVWYQRDSLIPFLKKNKYLFLFCYFLWGIIITTEQNPDCFDGVLYNVISTTLLGCVLFGFGFSFSLRNKRDYSYGFYLYHMIIINLFVEIGIDKPRMLLFIIIACISFLASMGSFFLIEKPFDMLLRGEKWKH